MKRLLLILLTLIPILVLCQIPYQNRYKHLSSNYNQNLTIDHVDMYAVLKCKNDQDTFFVIKLCPISNLNLQIPNIPLDTIAYIVSGGVCTYKDKYDIIVEVDELTNIYLNKGLNKLITHCEFKIKKNELSKEELNYFIYLCWINDVVVYWNHVDTFLLGYHVLEYYYN